MQEGILPGIKLNSVSVFLSDALISYLDIDWPWGPGLPGPGELRQAGPAAQPGADHHGQRLQDADTAGHRAAPGRAPRQRGQQRQPRCAAGGRGSLRAQLARRALFLLPLLRSYLLRMMSIFVHRLHVRAHGAHVGRTQSCPVMHVAPALAHLQTPLSLLALLP